MIAALALLLLAPGETFPDPIGPAAEGKLQCYSPDRARKLCQALAGYRSDGKGGFLNDAEVLILPERGLAIRTTTPVALRDGAVCGQVTRDAYEKAEFRVNGELLPAEKAGPLRDALVRASAALFDREICTRYPQSGDHLVAKGTMGGEAMPDQEVIWVSTDEGWRIGS